APRRLDQPGFDQIAARPVEAVGEDRLLPARHQPAKFLRGNSQRFRKLLLDARNMYLFVSLTNDTQSRKHQLLETRQRHYVPHIRNTPKRVGSIGALRQADRLNESTRRVSAGAMTPSSHNRAVA